MQTIGGGEMRMKEYLDTEIRIGGGSDDIWRTMNKVFEKSQEFNPVHSPEYYVKRMSGYKGILKVSDFKYLGFEEKQNFRANPGPTFKNAGFQSKGEALTTSWDLARTIENLSKTQEILGLHKPRYAMAGRTKKGTKEKFDEKVHKNKILGRNIFMADAHESHICSKFSVPFLNWCRDASESILLGFNKFGADPLKLVAQIQGYSHYVNGDFSEFDLSIPSKGIEFGFDIIRNLFGIDRSKEGLGDNQLLNWLEDELVNTLVVLPTGKVTLMDRGLPSGSGLTAILGTILNFVMMTDSLEEAGLNNYYLGVCGDDNIVAYNEEDFKKYPKMPWNTAMEKRFQKVSDCLTTKFSATFNPDKCHYADELFVGYIQPKVPKDILDKSSTEIGLYRATERIRLGRPLRFVDKFINLDEEPIGPAPGKTHRWSYLFHRRIKFLSHYFKLEKDTGDEKVLMVRPLIEVVSNINLPERRVKNLTDHMDRLQTALIENWGNKHVINHIMHYYYDAFIMKECGIYTRTDLRFWKSFPGIEKRGWYRRVDYNVDILIEDRQFDKFWSEKFEMARKVNMQIFGGKFVNWVDIRNLRSGRTLTGPGRFAMDMANQLSIMEKLGNKGNLEALGPLGLFIWANNEIRAEISRSFITASQEMGVQRYDPSWLKLRGTIGSLRETYHIQGL